MRIPSLDAPPIPPKNESGTDTTSAQGQDTTRNTSALLIHLTHSAPFPISMNIGGITARSRAPITTQGVYHLANLVIKPSTFAFFSDEFSTSSRILDTVLSENFEVVFTLITPVRLTLPLITLSPTAESTGILSPVNAAVFMVVVPSITSPSRAIFSPGFMTIVSPISTASGDTSIS